MGAERKQRLNLMCFSFVCSKTNVVSQISVESLVSSIFKKRIYFVGMAVHTFNLSFKEEEAGGSL